MGNKTGKAPSERPEAKPRAQFGTYSLYWEEIVCPRCARTGKAKWEEGPSKQDKQLIGIDGDFYERLSNKAPYDIELVCNGCGAVQPRRTGRDR